MHSDVEDPSGRAQDHAGAEGDALGGRLALLPTQTLTDEQQLLLNHLQVTRGAAARHGGYLTALPDGRLIGPFNALLRAPGIGLPYVDWAQAISASALSPAVREAAILVVAAHWEADYVLYAHRKAARAAGLSHDAVQALVAGGVPSGAPPAVGLAVRLATALVLEHDVPDDLYEAAVHDFGEHELVALLCVIGQYHVTAVLTACFRVPAPG